MSAGPNQVDCIVAGAGVIGLAVGRQLALAGRSVVVVEAEEHVGSHTSSRNSEVIHAGIYYPADSLKARFCVAGKHALYDYCAERGIGHCRIGKLIVATGDDEEPILASIQQQARANGVMDLRNLSTSELRQLEPAVRATAALLSPSTGIVDTHEYMLALQGDLEAAGGSVVRRSRISDVRRAAAGFDVSIDGDYAATCRSFVNAAGLWAAELSQAIDTGGNAAAPATHLARGHYFSYTGRSPFRHLIYPVPVSGGLGIHATKDLSGAVRFGPDVEWIDEIDYAFSGGLKETFLAAVRRYFPDVDGERMQPSYTGIRPKLSGPGEPPADFLIEGPATHGVDGLVNLFGIESPGLTASLAIADHVSELLD